MYYSIPSVKKAVWEGSEANFDLDLSRPVKRFSGVSFENVNDLAVGFYDNTRSVANGDHNFGVDYQ